MSHRIIKKIYFINTSPDCGTSPHHSIANAVKNSFPSCKAPTGPFLYVKPFYSPLP